MIREAIARAVLLSGGMVLAVSFALAAFTFSDMAGPVGVAGTVLILVSAIL